MSWRKSSKCDAGACGEIWVRSSKCANSECGEIARTDDGVLIRNSRRPDVVTELDHDEWVVLRDAIKDGEFG